MTNYSTESSTAHSFCNGGWRPVRAALGANPLGLRRESEAGRVGVLTAVLR